MEYNLEIRQLVDYPKCRIYRDFVQTLIEDKNIRTTGGSYLFYYTTLFSYANFRSSYERLDGISYLVTPGEWICRTSTLAEWFRVRFQHQAIAILEDLQRQNLITYSKLGKGKLIKYQITSWADSNTALEYNYPCLKDVGFFFFPIAKVSELISIGKCSEMDIDLDLWMHAIYQDERIKGSDVGPVVYFRNYSGNPVTNYAELATRWGISKATVCRVLNKFAEKGYLSLINFKGTTGSVIYLNNYLSTMFAISDVMIDKQEVSLSFEMNVCVPDDTDDIDAVKTVSDVGNQLDLNADFEQVISDSQIVIKDENIVSNDRFNVSNSHILYVVRKVLEILVAHGIQGCRSKETLYKLLRLSVCKGNYYYLLYIVSPDGKCRYKFELNIHHT